MGDPAIEAARRAWEAGPDEVAKIPYREGAAGLWTEESMEAAAGEALKPIRELLDRLADDTVPPCDFGKRYDLFEKAISELSPLVYSTEELAGE